MHMSGGSARRIRGDEHTCKLFCAAAAAVTTECCSGGVGGRTSEQPGRLSGTRRSGGRGGWLLQRGDQATPTSGAFKIKDRLDAAEDWINKKYLPKQAGGLVKCFKTQ